MIAEAPSRIHLWSGLIVLGTFLAGGAAGAGLVTWLRPGPPHHGPHQPSPGWLPPPLAALDLTVEQQQKAKAIMEKHRPELEAVVRESFPRLRALLDQVDKELRGILTEPQALKFDELKAKRPLGPEGVPPGFAPGAGGPPPPQGTDLSEPPPGPPPGPPPPRP